MAYHLLDIEETNRVVTNTLRELADRIEKGELVFNASGTATREESVDGTTRRCRLDITWDEAVPWEEQVERTERRRRAMTKGLVMTGPESPKKDFPDTRPKL